MSLPYFYEPNVTSGAIALSDTSFHHAVHVLRMRSGDLLNLTDGRGTLHRCRIEEMSKRDCRLSLLETITFPPPKTSLHIAISFTKNPSRMEWFLEKATEIGIQHITPLLCQRSEKVHMKTDRIEKIMVSAMLQSQQTYLPVLHPQAHLADVLDGPEPIKCIAHCVDGIERHALSAILKPQKNTLILIGPEGDFTPEEITSCLASCQAVTLGEKRLRTETAGLFACVVFNSQIAGI